jgi:hypothetical protein
MTDPSKDVLSILNQWEAQLKLASDPDELSGYSLTPREQLSLIEFIRKIQSHVSEQAEDEALWSLPCDENGKLKLQPIGEAYLQQELRHLHRTIEDGIGALTESLGK